MPPTTGTKLSLAIGVVGEDGEREKVECTLRFRARAWETFEKETGRSVLKGELENLGLSDVVTLIWAGLLHERPHLSRDEVADAIGLRDLNVLQHVIARAITDDMPVQESGAAEKKRTRKTTSP